MARIQARNFHRLAIAVDDVAAATAWFERVLGAVAMHDSPTSPRSGGQDPELGNLAGTESNLFWVGGYPVILLSGGAVARFLQRHGPGVQSVAWEVDDNWSV